MPARAYHKTMEVLKIIIIYLIAPVIISVIGYQIAVRRVKRDFHDKALQNRYYLVYSPLRSLLLETHITSASLGFYWSQRIERAWPYFKKLKIGEGFKRLDKNFGANPLHEVEFGNDFPLEEIKKVIKKSGKWADVKIINLTQKADRASWEKVAHSFDGKPDGLLEDEKHDLAIYIWDTYEKLNRRLLPQN